MAGIDRKVMTNEAIALRKGETVKIDGVLVRFTDRERLEVTLPDGMNGEQCQRWLAKNAALMGYVQVDKSKVVDQRQAKRPAKSDDDFTPLLPHVEG